MKLLCSHLAAVGIITICVFAIISLSGASEQARLSLLSKTAEKGKTIGTGTQTATYYDVTITLYNAGNVTSPQITLGIQDDVDGIWTNKTETIAAKESKDFFFNDWPIMGPGDHTISISYRPTNDSIAKTSFNSGIDILSLEVTAAGDQTKETPGFELFALLSALFIILLLKKR